MYFICFLIQIVFNTFNLNYKNWILTTASDVAILFVTLLLSQKNIKYAMLPILIYKHFKIVEYYLSTFLRLVFK